MTFDIEDRKNAYCKIFSQAFSPNGKYVAVADRYGRVTLFNLSNLLRSCVDEKTKQFCFQFQPKSCPIYAIITVDVHLICGCADGTAVAFLWTDLEKQKARPVFLLNSSPSSPADQGSPFEINAFLKFDQNEGNIFSSRLYSAGGDCKINVWDLETRKVLISLTGHSDYIHCLSHGQQNSIISGSEDGTVRFWDARTKSCVHMIEPFKTECARPSRGKWIGCVAADRDWLVCGGGPSLGFWHLASYSLLKPLEANNVDHHSVLFHDNKIIGAGDNYKLNHWNFKGDLLTSVPVSSLITYDIQFNNVSNKNEVLCSFGSGSKGNVFVNLNYSAFTLDVSN